MGCTQVAMDIDLPIEFGPTEETVEALIDYLVGPLLPLKHSDIAKETLSESQKKTVAKQIHAAVILYNYYHLNHHQESEFLNFDQFCKLAIMFKPSILHHMKYMCQSDHPTITDPKNQLSVAEKAIMDACTISRTLLNDSGNVLNMIKEWPITKVAVLLIDSKKENCFLQFIDGVWSVIEKEIYYEESGIGNESKIGKKRMGKNDEEGELGYQKLVFSAVKEVTGIENGKLKVLESHVVYSLSQAKTATRFYIVQSTQSISEDNLVPIQDVISSLQGPVVNKCSGSWAITPVVEYYYLLPYAEIITQLFSRLSDNLQIKSKLESGNVSKVVKSTYKFDKCGTTLDPVFKVTDDVVTSSFIVSTFDQKVKETESFMGNGNISNISKEEPRDRKITENNIKSNKCGATLEPVSKVADDVITSPMIESPVDQKVKEAKNSVGNRITDANEISKVSDNLQIKSKSNSESVHISKSCKENNIKSNKCGITLEPASKVEDDVIITPMIVCPFDQKVKEDEDFVGNRITGTNEINKVLDNLQIKSKSKSENVHISNSCKEEPLKSNKCGITLEPASKVEDDVITTSMIVSPIDQKVKEAEKSVGNRITGANSDSKRPQDMNGSCRVESMNSSSGDNNTSIDKPMVCSQKVNQNTKLQTPLRVYRHEKRTTLTSSKRNKGDLKGLKTISMISECNDEKTAVGEKKSCMVSLHENRTLTVNHDLENFNFTVDAKKSELSQAALRALVNKRQKLCSQQHIIETELTLCDKKIQAIMQSGIEDCLGIKLEAIIDCCNEFCLQGDMPAQQHTNLLAGSSLPKSLSEAQLTLRKACQELDDICLLNNWMLPKYHTSNSNGGFVANVTVKGTNFECSGVSRIQPSIHEARNSAATHLITKLQQMTGQHSIVALV